MIGIVTGMIAEVKALGDWAKDDRVMVALSAASPERAEHEARRLVEAGCTVLVSWGLAGGLSDALSPGDVVTPAQVVTADGEVFDVPGQGGGNILGVEHVIATPTEKSALQVRTGAIAVDMESHRIARVSKATGVLLQVIRAVSDPSGRSLPTLAANALGPDGRPMIGRVVAGLVRRPWELPRLIDAKRDSDRALAALRSAAPGVMSELLKP